MQILPVVKDYATPNLSSQVAVVFELNNADDLPTLVTEMLRLGNDRQGFRWFAAPGDNDTRRVRQSVETAGMKRTSVALSARRPYCGPSGSVEQPKLDSDRVGHLAHDAAKRVHFAYEVPLGNSTDSRIAGHLGDEINIQRVKGCLQPHARTGHRGLAAGVAGSDYDDLELFRELHGTSILQSDVGRTLLSDKWVQISKF